MALGRQKGRQADLMIGWGELPRSPGHVFYDRLQTVLVDAGFDAFAELQCKPFYASRQGRPSLPPGRYFRMHLVGYFEGIDSERGLAPPPSPDGGSCGPGSAGLLAADGAVPTACRCGSSCAWGPPSRYPTTPGSAGPARGCR